MSRLAAVLLLALLGVAACGGDESEPSVGVPSWAKVAPEQIAEAQKHGVPVAFENDLGMRFVLIPAGTFLMGSSSAASGVWSEAPQHRVTLTRPLYVQVMEVTNGAYRHYRPGHDSGFWGSDKRENPGAKTDNRDEQPATRVRWKDASAFATWLTERGSGRRYRLPSEAEWEYACRAGTVTAYAFGDSVTRAQAAMGGSIPPGEEYLGVVDVGSFQPNAWGILDMHGNACEWCADWYAPYPGDHVEDPSGPVEGTHKIVRGGSAQNSVRYYRSACRGAVKPEVDQGGFRLVSPLPER